MIECPNCKSELDEIVDTVFSNYKSKRAEEGQHTGDIYKCNDCDILIIDDFLDDIVREWAYE